MPTNPYRKKYTVGMKDFYDEYKWIKKREDGVDIKDGIPYKKYKAALVDLFKIITNKIVKEQFIFILPNKLGSIYIKSQRRSPKNAPIDWKETKKHKKLIRHLNLHTFGYFFYTTWERSYSRFRNKLYYRFNFTYRDGKKPIGKHIKEISKDPTKRSYLRF